MRYGIDDMSGPLGPTIDGVRLYGFTKTHAVSFFRSFVLYLPCHLLLYANEYRYYMPASCLLLQLNEGNSTDSIVVVVIVALPDARRKLEVNFQG